MQKILTPGCHACTADSEILKFVIEYFEDVGTKRKSVLACLSGAQVGQKPEKQRFKNRDKEHVSITIPEEYLTVQASAEGPRATGEKSIPSWLHQDSPCKYQVYDMDIVPRGPCNTFNLFETEI